MRTRMLLALSAAAAGCAAKPRTHVGPLRYAVADPVKLVNDRAASPAPPESFDVGLIEYYVKEVVIGPTRRALTIGPTPPAQNINSLGEVPDSAWFTNRTPTPAQIEHGPGGEGPDRSEPWHVIGVKVGGAAIGITIKDARGDEYVLKFDERGFPETESAADVIVQRLTWAFGYNVPENNVVNFKREDLVLDPKAEVKFRSGKKRPMTEKDLAGYLDLAESDGGSFRALASKLIGGKIVGGVEPTGTRDGDPNDRVPHELRRDLRGQRVLWSWVNHVDLKSQNTLAAFTDDKYMKWYALDFGESLGVGARTTHVPRLGHKTTYSAKDWVLNLVTFGLRVMPYERKVDYPQLRGLGDFDAETFDPAAWVPNYNWRPTDVADRWDEFWGAEILMKLSRAHIEAAVRAGRYTDPRTARYVTDTLVERQRKLGKYAFSRVAPLSGITARVAGKAVDVCFEDLWLTHGYGRPAETSYRANSFDYAGASLGARATVAASGPHTCVTVPAASGHDGYTIAKIEPLRGDHWLPPVFVHVAAGKVIGIDRR